MIISWILAAFSSLLFVIIFIGKVNAHGFMEFPCQRGTLNPNNIHAGMCNDKDAPSDYLKHFLAGDKSHAPGSGHRSQIATGGK